VLQLPASNRNGSHQLNCSSLTNSFTIQLFTSLHCTELTLTVLLITPRQRPHRKHRSSVSVQLLLSGPHRKHCSFVALQLLHVKNLLPSGGRCLQSRYLAAGLHATMSCNAVWSNYRQCLKMTTQSMNKMNIQESRNSASIV
jgi:hypothetical protein